MALGVAARDEVLVAVDLAVERAGRVASGDEAAVVVADQRRRVGDAVAGQGHRGGGVGREAPGAGRGGVGRGEQGDGDVQALAAQQAHEDGGEGRVVARHREASAGRDVGEHRVDVGARREVGEVVSRGVVRGQPGRPAGPGGVPAGHHAHQGPREDEPLHTRGLPFRCTGRPALPCDQRSRRQGV